MWREWSGGGDIWSLGKINILMSEGREEPLTREEESQDRVMSQSQVRCVLK